MSMYRSWVDLFIMLTCTHVLYSTSNEFLIYNQNLPQKSIKGNTNVHKAPKFQSQNFNDRLTISRVVTSPVKKAPCMGCKISFYFFCL